MTAGRRLALWAPVVLLLALEAVLSHQPKLPHVLPLALPAADKLAHFAYFAVVGYLAARAARAGEGWSPGRTLVTVALGALLWGLTDEVHQSFVPGRDPEALDVLADTLGALAGAAAHRRAPGRAPNRVRA